MANYGSWRAFSRSALTSKKLKRCDDAAAHLWLRMMLAADSHGRQEADPEALQDECLPNVPGWTPTKISRTLQTLVDVGLVVVWHHPGDDTYAPGDWCLLVDFDRHQPREFTRKRGKAQSPEPPAKVLHSAGAPTQGRTTLPSDIDIEGEVEPTAKAVVRPTGQGRRTPADVAADLDTARTACGTVATMVDDLVALMASENKTGKLADTRALRELWQPVAALVAEVGEVATMAGCRAALTNGAPNANYVAKAARSAASRRDRAPAPPVTARTSAFTGFVAPVGAGTPDGDA